MLDANKREAECNNKKLCAAVVDDANGVVYLYGNVVHENYHAPGSDCVAFTAVPSAGFERKKADEWFEGVQTGDNITLTNTPYQDNSFLVFLNGVKQRAGSSYDYTVSDKVVHFNSYSLLATDVVEVMYEYGAN